MDSSFQAHLIFALGWLSFGAAHSLLAGSNAKNRLQHIFGAYYRLIYNVFAALHIGSVWWLGSVLLSTSAYAFDTGTATALTGIRVIGMVVLVLALREYDLGLFSGMKQIRAGTQDAPDPKDEPLVTDGLHRFVRHPLYLGVTMIFWGGAVNEFELATALWGSIYLFIGARHEESMLVKLYGDAYRDYQGRVPAVIPWRLGKRSA